MRGGASQAFQNNMKNEIWLREVRPGDLPVFFEQQLDPEATRMAAFPSRAREAFMAHWEKTMAGQTNILRTIVFDSRVAGNIVSWETSGERRVGYWLGKDYWGQGIASAALAQFLEQVKIRPLHARVARKNAASIRVLQKCGFRISGEDTFCELNGEPGSEFIMILEAQGPDENK
jgi:RimJ/RimL family protein N-acetyltransferase